MIICDSCGASNTDDAKFCQTCGSPLPEAPAAEPASESEEEPVKASETSSADGMESFETPVPDPAAATATTSLVTTPAAYDYQQQSGSRRSDYYEEPKTYSGKTIPGNAYGIEGRNIVVCMLLSIVTCGIYMLYWQYKINEELKQLSGDDSLTDGALVILFSLLTCGIYMIYWQYKMGQACDKAKGDIGGNSAILYMLLQIFGLYYVSFCLEQHTINQLVA